jgi:DNA-directed RNA polymerase specialized sigma24 family protein
MSTVSKPAPFKTLDPDLRSALVAMVRKRVPESEVEDIVQQALAEAIESPHAPQDSESLRRWIFGVAKNKVVDYHRRAGRESFDLPDVEGTPAPHVEADLLRWAEKNLPEGAENKKTLDWMLREGEGEKLESIAASEKLPPPRVRQRVSRLRRHFKENWQREVAMLAALGVIVSAIMIYVIAKKGTDHDIITHDVVDPRAEPMRRLALEKCAGGEWKPCVDGLDEARRLDPAGDARPEVQQARDAAANALKLQPAPSTPPSIPPSIPPLAPSAIPTTTPPSVPSAQPTSNLTPTPAPLDSAPRFDQKMKPQAPSKSDSFDSLSSPSPAPMPTPTPKATPVPTAEATAVAPSKDDSAPPATKGVAKPQGKKASPKAPSGDGNTTPAAPGESSFGGGSKK